MPPPQVKPPDVTDGTIGGSSAGHAVPYPQELAYGSMLRLWIANAEEEEWRRYYDPNLAGGGVFVPTNEPPEVGATVRLEIAFGAGPRFFMTGLITWRRPPLRDPRTRAGVGVQVHPSERGKLQYLNRWVLGSVSDQRGRRRLPIKLQVAYTARTGRRVNFTRDLSETGVFVRSRELLDLDTPIELLLMPPHRRQPIRVQGRVSRLVRDPENRGMGISLAFRSDSERDHYALFIEDLEQKFLKGELSEEMLF